MRTKDEVPHRLIWVVDGKVLGELLHNSPTTKLRCEIHARWKKTTTHKEGLLVPVPVTTSTSKFISQLNEQQSLGLKFNIEWLK